jgi:hypothetical protein
MQLSQAAPMRREVPLSVQWFEQHSAALAIQWQLVPISKHTGLSRSGEHLPTHVLRQVVLGLRPQSWQLCEVQRAAPPPIAAIATGSTPCSA